jgi:hypothetical protein
MRFRTTTAGISTPGRAGDFETLVRLLVPRPVDPRVGTRDMDLRSPGPTVRGLDNPALGGVLRLGGALRAPAAAPTDPPTVDPFEAWDQPFPRPLQTDLARLVNLPDDTSGWAIRTRSWRRALYGRWHAMVSRVSDAPDAADTWVQRLNLDPRFPRRGLASAPGWRPRDRSAMSRPPGIRSARSSPPSGGSAWASSPCT